MSQRIGILGGTFDPIHRGHVDLGLAACRVLGLPELLVLPSYRPPHREQASASMFHRFAMAAMAVAGRDGWRASDLELRLGEVPSYTIATLQRFRERGYAATDIFFVIGADAFADVMSWKSAGAVLDGTNFAVVSRPGHPVAALPDRLPDLAPRMVHAPVHDSRIVSPLIFLIDAPTADMSSTAIRRLREEGRPITGMVDVNVEQHIERHGLYRSGTHGRRRSDRPSASPAGRLHGTN